MDTLKAFFDLSSCDPQAVNHASMDAAIWSGTPAHIREAYRAAELIRAEKSRAYDQADINGWCPWMDPSYLKLKAAYTTAFQVYTDLLNLWAEGWLGRPLHDYEPGHWLIVFRRHGLRG